MTAALLALSLLASPNPSGSLDRDVLLVTTVVWVASDGAVYPGDIDEQYGRVTKFYFRSFYRHKTMRRTRKMLETRPKLGEEAVAWFLDGAPDSDAELTAWKKAVDDLAIDVNFDSFIAQQGIKHLGQVARVRQLEETEVNVIVAPLIGQLCVAAGKDTVVINPVAHPGEDALRKAVKKCAPSPSRTGEVPHPTQTPVLGDR